MKRFVAPILAALLCAIPATALAAAKGPSAPLVFNRDNAVNGLKNGKLYAYVDLASSAKGLQSLNESVIIRRVLDASLRAADAWWKTEKYTKSSEGIVDIVTILNKDEYAKADFSSALLHGKVYLKRVNNVVVIERNTLSFANLKQARIP